MGDVKKLLGRFYFKTTDNGNLIGEFSNNASATASTESADLIGESAGCAFVGTYHSTWQEKSKPLFAELTIKKPGNAKLFSLEWSRNGKPIFRGQGMLCDGILIGDYQSAES